MDITLLEVHLEEGSFSANLPFSNLSKSVGDEDEDEELEADETDETVGAVDADADGGSGKKLGVLGVFVFLVVVAALVRYLSGDDEEPEVEIETPDDGPVGVTVDTEDE